MVETTHDAMDDNETSNANALTAGLVHLENSPEQLEPSPELPEVIEVNTLNQCFHAVLLSRKVRISFATYKYIVQHDLEVPHITTMNDSDVTVLSKSVNFFMTQWPGWIHRNTFSDGPIAVSTWYNDYKQFLRDRVMYVVNNLESLWEVAIADHVKDGELNRPIALTDYHQPSASNGESSTQNEMENSEIKPDKNRFECGVQTDQLEFAPYHLAFSGQPAALNSLYFVITQQGHASARFHNPLKLESISAKQLLNSPYVSVNVTLPEISFGRKMDHKYTRFITTRAIKKGTPSTDLKISTIKRLDNSKYDTDVYSHEFLKEYFEQFFGMLRKHKFVTEGRISELEVIVDEFLEDILDCNLYDNTMATNMSVTFRLGGHTYVRNKVWRQGVKFGSISYVERIEPRSTFFLKSVSAEQDTSTVVPSFTLLNKIDRAALNNETDNPDVVQFLQQLRDDQNCISYSCTLCEKVFSYYQLLYKHYSSDHGGEQAVLCDVCGDKQNMLILTTKRWEHRCCREVPKDEPVDQTELMSSSGYNSCNFNCNATDDASSTCSGAGSFLNGLMKEEPKQEDTSMDIVEEETVVNLITLENGV